MNDFEAQTLKLFRAAVGFLRVDSESCAPSEWNDVVTASNVCADVRIWCLQGLLPTLTQSDIFFEAIDATEMMLATFVIICPSNAEVVSRWRQAYAAMAELGTP